MSRQRTSKPLYLFSVQELREAAEQERQTNDVTLTENYIKKVKELQILQYELATMKSESKVYRQLTTSGMFFEDSPVAVKAAVEKKMIETMYPSIKKTKQYLGND